MQSLGLIQNASKSRSLMCDHRLHAGMIENSLSLKSLVKCKGFWMAIAEDQLFIFNLTLYDTHVPVHVREIS